MLASLLQVLGAAWALGCFAFVALVSTVAGHAEREHARRGAEDDARWDREVERVRLLQRRRSDVSRIAEGPLAWVDVDELAPTVVEVR